MMNGRACAKGIRVYIEKSLATLLPKWSTVDGSLKRVIKTHFVSLLDTKATLYYIEHSIVFRDIGVFVITRYL